MVGRENPAPPTPPGARSPPRMRGARKTATRSTRLARKNSHSVADPPSTRRLAIPSRASFAQQNRDTHLPGAAARQAPHGDSTRDEPADRPALRRARGHDDHAFGIAEKPRALRNPQTPVQDDPPVRRDPIFSEAPRQPRVVGQNRSGSDQDRIELLAKQQSPLPRLPAGDPPALPARGRRPSVQSAGPLGQDEGAPSSDPDGEFLVQALGLPALFRRRRQDPDSRPPEGREPAPGDEGVRVARRGDEPPDSRGEDRVGAGRSPAQVRARLEGHVQIRPRRPLTRLRERRDLRMRTARVSMKPRSHDAASAHDHGPDHRIGRDRVAAALGQLQSAVHPPHVRRGSRRFVIRDFRGISCRGSVHVLITNHQSHHLGFQARSSPSSARAYSEGSKGMRSSIPSPTPTKRTGSPSSR